MITIYRPLTKTGRFAPKHIAKAYRGTKIDASEPGIAEVPLKAENGETLVIRMDAPTIDRMHAAAHGIKSGKSELRGRRHS